MVSHGEEQVVYGDSGDGTEGIVILIIVFLGILIAAVNRASDSETKQSRPKSDIYKEDNEEEQKVMVPERIPKQVSSPAPRTVIWIRRL